MNRERSGRVVTRLAVAALSFSCACSSPSSTAVKDSSSSGGDATCGLRRLEGSGDAEAPEIELLTGLPTPKSSPTAEQLTEAKRRAGAAAESHGETARVMWDRAYELSGDPELLYGIGETYRQMNDFVGARIAFLQYLKRVPSAPAEKREHATSQIALMGDILGWLTLRCSADGTQVAVDDAVVMHCPAVGRVALNPGYRQLKVSRANGTKCEVRIVVESKTRTAYAIAPSR